MKQPKFRIPSHPGLILSKDLMGPLHMSLATAAQRIGLRTFTLRELLKGKASVTPSIARMLERAFNIPAQTWLNLQRAHDLGKTGYLTKRVRFRRPFSHYEERRQTLGLDQLNAEEIP